VTAGRMEVEMAVEAMAVASKQETWRRLHTRILIRCKGLHSAHEMAQHVVCRYPHMSQLFRWQMQS
jgi:hypothetical protein